MPVFYNSTLLFILLSAAIILPMAKTTVTQAYEGIQTYYIRYDVHSSKNTITADNLLMIPAKNDFRTENFSQQSITGALSSAPGESDALTDKRIKEDALKSILVKHGLKSLTSKDLDTVISYEGAVTTPIHIMNKAYRQEENTYLYKVQVIFSPMAFPDEWETLGMKHRIKEMVENFFQLFR